METSSAKSLNTAPLIFRTEPRISDSAAIREMVTSTGFFDLGEIEIAVELLADRLSHPAGSTYNFVFADIAERTVGYSCYGEIPCTDKSFDLYWIVVHPDFQGSGLGASLMKESEKLVASLGGRNLYVETAGRAQYLPTRRFYDKLGYIKEAVFADFYAPGDDKIVYVKRLE